MTDRISYATWLRNRADFWQMVYGRAGDDAKLPGVAEDIAIARRLVDILEDAVLVNSHQDHRDVLWIVRQLAEGYAPDDA
jgi:hypothetical protein